MKNSYLFAGIAVLLIVWSKELWLAGLLLFLIIVYYRRHFIQNIVFYLLMLCVMIRLFFPMQTSKPASKILQVKEIKSNYIIASTGKQKVVVYHAGNVSFNDVIEVKGSYQKIDGVRNFRMFYYPEWMKRRNIQYEIKATSIHIKKQGVGLRHELYARLSNMADSPAKHWIKSMIYGIHEDDVSFFVTSSGMHIAFLFQLLQNLLLIFLSKTAVSWFVLAGMGMLGYITVLSTSLLRMLCFRSVTCYAVGYSTQDRLGISIIFTLLLFPYMAFELAFLIPVVFRLVQIFNVQKRSKRCLNYLILVPIQYQFFHVCNPLQILFFRLLRSCYAVLYIFALCSLLTSTTQPYTWISWILSYLENIESFGFELYYTPHLLWLLLWMQGIMKFLTYRQYKTIIQLCLLFCYAPFSSYFNPFGEILMIDVGQGDCTLIRLPFHQGTMLIDVMGSRYKNIPADIIVPVLKAKGIHSLDKVILTHDDFDHSGGLNQLQELMEVKEVIHTKKRETVLNNVTIPFLLDTYVGSDANENSIITLLEVYGLRVLFMGDAGKASEAVLMREYPKLQADVLKVGHHGSKTASSLAFLHQLQPSIALISSGRNNMYGHPHKETMQNLERENIRPLISAKDGAVSIKFTPYFSFYQTAQRTLGLLKINYKDK